jgi:DNA-binding response OmpR family regulator
MPKILLIEDNRELARAVAYNLELEGYSVEVVGDGTAALESVRAAAPDLVLLDLTLPQLDGFTVLERLRKEGHEMPVMILTARGEEGDKVRGFRAGADQYVTKPFGLLELLERVRHLLRRHSRAPAETTGERVFRFGDIEVDLDRQTVRRGLERIALTPRAFDVLVALYEANGNVVSRLDLMRSVWGHRAAVMSRTVDVHIAELRRKLEVDAANPRYVLTVWKRGYRLERRPPESRADQERAVNLLE